MDTPRYQNQIRKELAKIKAAEKLARRRARKRIKEASRKEARATRQASQAALSGDNGNLPPRSEPEPEPEPEQEQEPAAQPGQPPEVGTDAWFDEYLASLDSQYLAAINEKRDAERSARARAKAAEAEQSRRRRTQAKQEAFFAAQRERAERLRNEAREQNRAYGTSGSGRPPPAPPAPVERDRFEVMRCAGSAEAIRHLNELAKEAQNYYYKVLGFTLASHRQHTRGERAREYAKIEGKEIKKAYMSLALLVHPDKNLGVKERAEGAFKVLGKAYEVLKDGGRRAQYDRDGKV